MKENYVIHKQTKFMNKKPEENLQKTIMNCTRFLNGYGKGKKQPHLDIEEEALCETIKKKQIGILTLPHCEIYHRK